MYLQRVSQQASSLVYASLIQLLHGPGQTNQVERSVLYTHDYLHHCHCLFYYSDFYSVSVAGGCPWSFPHVISFNPHNSLAGGIMIATSQEGRMRPREFKWPAQLYREVHGKCENWTRWGGSLGFAIRQTWSFSWCPWGCQSCRGHVLSFQIRPSWKSEGEPDAVRLNLSPDSSGRSWWKSAGLDEVCREGFLEGEGSLRT